MEVCMKDKDSRKGLTLLEVVVLVALLFLLAAFLIPAIIPMGPPHGHQGLRLASNGRRIYMQVFAAATENTGERTNFWAASNPNSTYANYEPTSTEYFRWLMTPYDEDHPKKGAGVVQQDFGAFAAPGIEPVSSLEEFNAEANPWMVTADLTETSPTGIPFMMTRNVNLAQLKDWRPNERQRIESLGNGIYEDPYGDETLIVVRMGGGSEVLVKKRLLWDILNPTVATNIVLQP